MAFHIHWANPEAGNAPDKIEHVPGNGIDPEFVISRNLDGTILSRYQDDVWDSRVYGAPSSTNFDSWWKTDVRGPMDDLARTLTDEIKQIYWLSQFESTTNAGHTRGRSYLAGLMTILRALAKMAYLFDIRLADAHLSAQFQVALRSSIANLESGFTSPVPLTGLLNDLAYWQSVDNIEIAVPRLVPEAELSNVKQLLLKIRKRLEFNKKQTPLIPTRILGKLIGGSLEQLKAAEPFLPKLQDFIRAIYEDPCLYIDKRSDYRSNMKRVKRLYPDQDFAEWSEINGRCVSKVDTLARFGLVECWAEHSIEHLDDLRDHISHLQSQCIFVIHAFTGMRVSEVKVMPFHPLAHPEVKGVGKLPILISHLKKFAENENYSRPMPWATSSEGVYAVEIAQMLAHLHWYRNRPADEEIPRNLPLWVACRINRPNPKQHYAVPIGDALFGTPRYRSTTESLGLVIEQSDLDELVAFDAFSEWDEASEFAVGKFWPLTSHQFRRSVAVYSSRSGMVSLPTLKTQYKHLSAAMTALYSENSSFAINFLIDEHGKPIENASVMSSFQDSLRFNTSLRFHEQVIESHSRTYGPRGTEIQRAKDKGKVPKIFESREATEKAIKQGKFSYKDTSVGGCTLKGVCPHFGVDVVLPCTSGCADAVLKAEKLETYVDSLRFDQAAMSPKSRPYKLIEAEIEYVTKTYLEQAEVDA